MTTTRSVMQSPVAAAQQTPVAQPVRNAAPPAALHTGHSLAGFATTPAVTPRMQLHALPRITPLGNEQTIQRDTACFIPSQDTPYSGMDDSGYVIAPNTNFHESMKTAIYNANEQASSTAKTIHAWQKSDYNKDAKLARQRDILNLLAEVDHAVPAALGGCNSFRNAAVISKADNTSKGDKYPYTKYGTIFSGWRVLYDGDVYASANKAEQDNVDVTDARGLRGY